MFTGLTWIIARVRAFFTTRHLDRDFEQELESHVAMLIEDNVRRGMTPAEARRTALILVGAGSSIKEQHRDARGLPIIEVVLQDVRHAVRGLARTPGFTAVAIITLALGIGANTAIFTLLDQALLRLLPVQHPRELVLVTSRGSHYGNTAGDGSELSYPLYLDFRDHNDVFEGMFARVSAQKQIHIDGQAEQVSAELVSDSYFRVLGVTAARGRTILPSDDAVSDATVTVLSYRYWLSRFGGEDSAIGRSIVLSRRVLTIIGVAEKGFDGASLGSATQIFVPMQMASMLAPISTDRPILQDRRSRWLNVFGRLRPGVTLEQAQAKLQPFYASRLAFEVHEPSFGRASETDKSRYLQNTVELRPAGDGKSLLRGRLAQPLWILMGVAATVLLIACANLANLLLARAMARRREFAVRLALGAGRRRLAQQLLVESLLLAFTGSAVGLIIATWGADALLRFVTPLSGALTLSAAPDGRILAFTLAVAALTGLGFGFAPAVQTTRPDLAPTLKDEAGAVAGGGYTRLRRTFVVIQVALSAVLLVTAGLFIRTLDNLMRTHLGFDATHVVSFQVNPEAAGYDEERGKTFIKLLRERIETTPGVAGAAFASQQLLSGGGWNNRITIEGRAYNAEERVFSSNNGISPGYFATMGIPLVAGRDFDARDERTPPPGTALSPRVAIANETFAKRYLGGKSPLGRRVGFGRDPGTPTPIEIVGLVSDARYAGVKGDIPPQLFFPFLEGPRVGLLTMYVRTREEPALIIPALRRVVQQLDPAIPVQSARTLNEQVEISVSLERLIALLTAAFGLLATLVAMIGLYGVLTYTVTRRTREIGVRVALGAAVRDISWLVTREVILLVAVGVAFAIPAIWGLTRVVESQLYGVTPLDPLTIALAIGLLAAVAAVAGFLPARRAARVDPLVALRYE